MGVVFFQLMVGQVPNGEVLGVLQTSGDHEEDKAVGLLAELPWPRFPERMLQLAALVASMTRRQMALRPSAARARRHEWFASESDEELPREVRAKLVGCGAAQVSREQIAMELAAGNNLQDLRLLVEELRRRPQEVERLLREHGVRAGVAREHQWLGRRRRWEPEKSKRTLTLFRVKFKSSRKGMGRRDDAPGAFGHKEHGKG